MRKLLIKVCGMRERDNIASLLTLSPDRVGFILYPPSKRYVGEEFCMEEAVPDIECGSESYQRVGVFVNSSVDNIVDIAKRNIISSVQLHGSESPEECAKLINSGLEVIKAFSVDNSFDFSTTEAYNNCCSFFLFDTKGVNPGGNGFKFSWELLKGYSGDTPFFLSGGIGLSDVEAIRSFEHPMLAGLDLNSAFEISPALKDIDKLREFIESL